jgi:hypothetical protein
MLGLIFLTVTPCWVTSCGSRDWAWETRFCTSTFAMSRFMPTWNETSSSIRPSLVLSDFM